MTATLRFALILVTILGVAGMGSAQSPAATEDNKKPTAANPSSPAPSALKPDGDYVGSEVCATCHAEQEKKFCAHHHGQGDGAFEIGGSRARLRVLSWARPGPRRRRRWQRHDPCPLHRRIPRTRLKKKTQLVCRVTPKAIKCSGAEARTSRGPWPAWIAMTYTTALRRNVMQRLVQKSRYGAPLTEHVGTKKPQPELCLSCHQMRRAQLQRSSHMPYREGKVTCTSCHNPHGSPNPSQLLQASINENCYSCHAERRGPFLWEHPPVMENCANCHEPHGSSNPELLKVRMPRVCDSCHDSSRHPTQPQPLGSIKNFNRGCTNCHSSIHGSNHPSGNFFLR